MTETIAEFAGIPLGAMGEPRFVILEELRRRGVVVSPTTVSNIRSGSKSGHDTLRKLFCAEMWLTDDASCKDELYLLVACKGLAIRKKSTGYLSHRFSSVGFTDEMATLLGIKSRAIRLVLKAMRVDLIFAAEENQGLDTTFTQTASNYLNDYTTPKNYADNLAITLREKWHPKTIACFYGLMYQTSAGPRAVATWVPYELEMFDLFYSRQNQLANPVTPFDRMVLQDYLQTHSSNPPKLADKISQTTGIRTDRETISVHRNALTYGQLAR